MGSIYSVFPAIYLVEVLLVHGILVEEFLVVAAFFFTGILIAVGGAKMAFMESYSMARIGAALACIPLISPFVVWERIFENFLETQRHGEHGEKNKRKKNKRRERKARRGGRREKHKEGEEGEKTRSGQSEKGDMLAMLDAGLHF
jgi:hypothetical protein